MHDVVALASIHGCWAGSVKLEPQRRVRRRARSPFEVFSPEPSTFDFKGWQGCRGRWREPRVLAHDGIQREVILKMEVTDGSAWVQMRRGKALGEGARGRRLEGRSE